MVVLYSKGNRLGKWSEAEQLFTDAARTGPVEFRDEAGNILARTIPQVTIQTTSVRTYEILKAIADLPEEPVSNPDLTGRDHDLILYGNKNGVR